jgi:hypothetical protein
MRMLMQAPGAQPATSIAAHGAFARAGEDRILIDFKYRFCDMPNDPNAYLLVYLSDESEPRDASTPLAIGQCDSHSCCVARVFVPQAGRPGSMGSSEWATFFGEFDRGSLNFTRGTYVELELRGDENACIEIDDWDPQISCDGVCHDLTGEGGVSNRDFLVLLAECGRDVAGQDHPKRCLDSKLSWNQYIDVEDILSWDAVLSADPPPLNLCEPPLPPGGTGTPISALPTDGLLIAGKPDGPGLQEDRLYAFNSDGSAPRADPLLPACVGPPYRGNGQLIQDPNGTLYQLHATQGLIRLDTAERVIAPFSQSFNGQMVYVGVQDSGDIWGYPDGYPHGLPILDVAFDPDDPNQVYVVPVVVESAYQLPGPTPYPHYKAAAQLTYAGGSWSVTQVYGYDYCADPCSDADPCFLSSCLAQDQCEIEVDGLGKVYVLSSSAHSPSNDWLVAYDASSGVELERVVLTDVEAGLHSPTGLLVSQYYSDTLYLTSSVDTDPNDPQTYVYRCDVDLSDPNAPLTVNTTIVIEQPTAGQPDYGYGYLATIVGLVEDVATGDLYALGLTLAKVEENLSTNDPLYQQLFHDNGTIYSQPTLAIVAEGTTGPFTADPLSGYDLALPLSLVYLGSGHLLGDLNCDGSLNGLDIDPFVLALTSTPPDYPEYYAQHPNCDAMLADCDENGSINGLDIDPFVSLLTGG